MKHFYDSFLRGSSFLLVCLFMFFGFHAFAQPSNDDCDGSEILDDVTEFCATYNALDFTYQNVNGNCAPELTSANVWFSFVAEGTNMELTVDPVNGGLPYISMFTSDDADPCGNLVAFDIPCVTTGEIFITNLEPGETYWIAINILNEFGDDFGDEFELCIDNSSGPPNADPCAPIAVGPTACQDGTNVGANFFTDFPPDCDFGENLVFFTTTLSGNNNALIVDLQEFGVDPIGQNAQVIVAQFLNGCDNAFTPIEWMCGLDQGPMEVTGLMAGEEYYIIIGTAEGDEGEFNLCLMEMGPDPCVVNDFCDIAVPMFPVTGDPLICEDGCNINAGPDDMGGAGCFDLTNQTVWFSAMTDNLAAGMNVTLTTGQLTFPSISVYTGSCNSLIPIDCNALQAGSVFLIDLTVNPNTTYYIAVTDLDGTNGEFELCVSTHEGLQVCNINNNVWENWSSNDVTGIGGPYCPGEEVEICYEVLAFDVAGSNCQWFQGIIPSFGDGWDPSSFGGNGEPVQMTTPVATQFQGTWGWHAEGQVHYNATNNIISTTTGEHGLKFCSSVEPGCPNTGLSNPTGCSNSGTALPGGWFAITPTGDQLCPFGDPNQNVDDVYGDGAGCGGTPGGWKVCFILKARLFPDCQNGPTFTDCSVNFMTFADGETGDWNTNECVGEFPSYFNASLNCSDIPEILTEDQEICTGQEVTIELFSTADPVDYSWTVSAPPSISGAAPGTGNFIVQTLTNSSNNVAVVTYHVVGTKLGCPAEKDIRVTVYPGLEVEGGDDFGCAQASFELANYVTVANGQGPYTWEWSNNVVGMSNVVNPNTTSEYTVSITDETTGCEGEATVLIEISDLFDVEIEGETMFCDEQSPQLISAIASGGSGVYVDYSWGIPGNPNPISTGQSNELSVNTAGGYSVTVTDDRGCPGVATFEVEINESPDPGLVTNPPDAEICPGGTPVVVISAPFYTTQLPAPPFTFTWEVPADFPEDIPTESTFSTATPGIYYLTVTDDNGCFAEGQVEIIGIPAPEGFSTTILNCYEQDSLSVYDLSAEDEVVNGGSGLPVEWFVDYARDSMIDDPSAHLSAPDTVYASIVGSVCSSVPIPVILGYLPQIPTVSASDTACDEGNGTGTFNLTKLDTIVNGGTTDPVAWYEDAGASDPIANPDNYTGAAETVYAVVTAGDCSSDPVPVYLIADILIDIFPDSAEVCDEGNGLGTWNLTDMDETVNGGTGSEVEWFTDSTALDKIADPTTYQSSEGLVYARVRDGDCVSSVQEIGLTVVIDVFNNDVTAEACDPGDGIGTFNLTSLETAINPDANASFTWLADLSGPTPIADPTNYLSMAGTIYVVTHVNACVSDTTPVQLDVVVNLDAFPAIVDACDPGDGVGTFDLTAANNTINGNSGLSVEFYEEMGLINQITNPDNYTSSATTIYAIVVDGECVSLPVEVTLTVSVTVDAVPTEITACDEGNNTGTFDLTTLNDFIDGGNGYAVTYYEDDLVTIPIGNPTAYVSSDGVVYAVVRDGVCASLPVEIQLNVEILVPANPADITVCDEGNNIGTFDLTSVDAIVNGGGSGLVGWYEDISLTVSIPTPSNYVSSDAVVYAQVVENGRCISDVVVVTLNVEIQLFAQPASPVTCDEGGGQGTFDLTEVDGVVNGGSGLTVNWFEDDMGTVPIVDPTQYPGTNGESVYAMITDGRCISDLIRIDLIVENNLPAFEATVISCDDGTGQGIFNLTNADDVVNGGLGLLVTWFIDINLTMPIADPTNYYGPAGIVYAVTRDGLCRSLPVEVTLELIQDVAAFPGADELCDEGGGEAAFDLETYNDEINGGSGLTVLWFVDAGLSNQINTATPFISSGQILYAIVRDGSCESEPVTYELSVNVINSFDASLTTCDEGGGFGTFDLTSLNNTINGGIGFAVEWYSDAGLTNPIANPSAYVSQGGQVFASVTDGFCRAPLITVPLTIENNLPASSTEAEECDQGGSMATFDLTALDGTVNDGTGLQVNWYTDGQANNPILNTSSFVTSSVTVYAQVVDGLCKSLVVDIDLIVAPNPIADAGEPATLTCTDTIMPLDGLGSSQGSNFSYSWSTVDGSISSGANTLEPIINQPGTYTLVVTDMNSQCSSSDEVTIIEDVNRPTVDAGSDKELNCSVSSVTLGGPGTVTGSQYDYIWRRGGQMLPGTDNRMIVVQEPGNYSLTVLDRSSGCISTDDVEVIDNVDVITRIDYTVDQPACFGEANGCILIDDVIGGEAPFTYSLDGVAYSGNNEICGLGPSLYTIYVRDANGCEGDAEVDIPEAEELFIDLGTNLLISFGDTATVTAEINIPLSEVDTIIWTPEVVIGENILQVHLTPEVQTTVTATLIASDGCQTSDLMNIFVSREFNVYAPNAFTPNGDDYNSVFMLYGDEEDVAGINVLRIFSRWGEKVFERFNIPVNDEGNGWDGSFKGQQMPPGVYGFYAEVTFTDGSSKLIKGDITLIRQQ